MTNRLELKLIRDDGQRAQSVATASVPIDLNDDGKVHRHVLEEGIASVVGAFIRHAEQLPVIDDGRPLDETEQAIVTALRQRNQQ
ncbi:hypothetical protein CH276_22660 [Rhodococcus sp. 06-470-2]|uniref:hypothetical protein n=1 Tax=unclassified Rhodococcus (in: high G+C Gram-positive bacteria) TaxID=192944 RepID=UPI000B9C314E|nr:MULTISPECIES: hypothetical protein [unclassified Rhodococcus (in: high G+C Gram-positive bacteria)]OZC59252.1 hypothetical protein CH276_22660 [Rhodococcus sp. 06-470-2]OZE66839.1 hypothetical protein CH265_07985 [Rhodococcus sp. 05-2221-1B]